MKVPPSQERPDFEFWSTVESRHQALTAEEVALLTEKLAEYAHRRFVPGYRFKLVAEYHGIPSGTGCTVVGSWPEVYVRWDKWSKEGFGATHPMEDMHFELDIRLQFVGLIGE